MGRRRITNRPSGAELVVGEECLRGSRRVAQLRLRGIDDEKPTEISARIEGDKSEQLAFDRAAGCCHDPCKVGTVVRSEEDEEVVRVDQVRQTLRCVVEMPLGATGRQLPGVIQGERAFINDEAVAPVDVESKVPGDTLVAKAQGLPKTTSVELMLMRLAGIDLDC
jgi:hypothetical protein